MSDMQVILPLFNRLNEIQIEKSLVHLEKIELDGKHPLTHFSEVTHNYVSKKKVPLFLYDDFFFLSNDLVHFTSLLFFLRPLINDPRNEGGTYFQNWYDARYLSYASVLHYAVYNFWDRLGDLLHCFFDTGLHDNRVYVSRVLNNLSPAVKLSEHFKDLSNMYMTNVAKLINDRNTDAHTSSLVTDHYFKIILARGEDQKVQAQKKMELPELFKNQIGYAHKGFELVLSLIQDKGTPSN